MSDNKHVPPDIGEGRDVDDDPQLILGAGRDVNADAGGDPTDDADGFEGYSPKLKETLVKRGFKSVDELVDSYLEQESKATKLREDVDRLSFQPPPVMPSPEQVFPEDRTGDDLEGVTFPDDPGDVLLDREKGRKFLQDAALAISRNVEGRLEKKNRVEKARAMYAETVKYIQKDPQKFEQLRPTMVQLAQRYPNASIKELYGEAERMQSDSLKAQADALRKEVFGDIPPERIQALLSKANPAHIAGGGTSGGTGQDLHLSEQQKIEKEIKQRILDAGKMLE